MLFDCLVSIHGKTFTVAKASLSLQPCGLFLEIRKKNICSFKNNRKRCKRFVLVMFLLCSNYWMFELVFCILAHHENAIGVVILIFADDPSKVLLQLVHHMSSKFFVKTVVGK